MKESFTNTLVSRLLDDFVSAMSVKTTLGNPSFLRRAADYDDGDMHLREEDGGRGFRVSRRQSTSMALNSRA
jgi:hypothetical protein